ncbi:RNA demethylase ALKBH9B-like isoform X2 [Prosopis cineraria]|uniref:RNA demethylase ALKBH9B-like isoform X2 n=1 Tax=Prosopis cineraria TaxID=364024 RepID=UPI00240F1D97|nr:RNA demethylase ALKBH9B-like isoform X2 [Prosopis cineraria]
MDGQRFRSDDPFLLNYQPSELRIASEFFTTWLPFLSKDLCCHCSVILSDRIRSIDPEAHGDAPREQFVDDSNASVANNMQSHETCDIHDDSCDTNSLGSWKDGAEASYSGEASGWSEPVTEISVNDVSCEFPLLETPSPRMSWADMAQEDEFGEEEHNKLPANASPSDGTITRVPEKPKLSWEQREYIRFMNVRRKIDYMCFERVNGKLVNILEGLELHTGIFSAAEQKRIVNFVASLQEMGKKGELKDRTYSAPQKWMRGKGRQTIQFGCCYNYATDKDGKPPGILQNVIVDPIPDLFKVIIRRLIRSVLVLNGNGADVAKHCVPAVSSKRISITFRRMDVSKRPIGYVPEPDLQGIQPLAFEEKRSNGSRHNRRRRGRRNDAMGPAIGRDRNLEPHELTQSAQRSSSRQSRGRPGS